MPTIFDRPMYKLAPDSQGCRMYAIVDNRLEVSLLDRDTYHVPVAVPTELFTLFREVLRVDPLDTVTMAVDQVADEKYLFSLLYAGGDTLVDLWHYSRGSLPGFLLDKAFRL